MGNLNSTSAIIDKTQANGNHSPNRLINKCDQQTQDPTKQELYRLLHFEMDKKPTEIAEKTSNDDLSSAVTSSIVQDVNETDQNLPVPDKIINMLESGEFSQRESAPTVYAPKKKFLKDYQSNVESEDVPLAVKHSTVGSVETNITPTPSIRNFSSGFDEIIQASLSGTKAPDESKVAPTHKALNISSCIEAIVESELKKYEQTQDPSTELQDSNFYLTGSTKQRPGVDPASETMSIRSYLIQNASANSSGAKSSGSGMNRDAVAVPASSAMSRQTGRGYDDRTDRNRRSPATNAAPNHQMYRTFVDEKYHSPNVDTRMVADDYPRNVC